VENKDEKIWKFLEFLIVLILGISFSEKDMKNCYKIKLKKFYLQI
jgi:hypothetical protein